jgi:hypothetical protein
MQAGSTEQDDFVAFCPAEVAAGRRAHTAESAITGTGLS